MITSKKSMHISLKTDTHMGFKMQCVQRGLSMQEVFEEFASRVANESNDVLRIMDQLIKDKQVKVVKKYTKTDVDSIFNLLEEEDPLKGGAK
jgi:hypothetical protein